MFQRYCRRRWGGAVVAAVSVMARGATSAFDRAFAWVLFRNGIESGISAAFTRKVLDGPGTENNIAAPGRCGGGAVPFVVPKRGKAHHTEMANHGSVQRGHRNQWPFDTTWSFPHHELGLYRPNWLARHAKKAGGTPDVVNHYDVVAITATTPGISVPPAAPAPGRARTPTRCPRQACPAHRHRHPCRHRHPDRPRLRWARKAAAAHAIPMGTESEQHVDNDAEPWPQPAPLARTPITLAMSSAPRPASLVLRNRAITARSRTGGHGDTNDPPGPSLVSIESCWILGEASNVGPECSTAFGHLLFALSPREPLIRRLLCRQDRLRCCRPQRYRPFHNAPQRGALDTKSYPLRFGHFDRISELIGDPACAIGDRQMDACGNRLDR